MMVIKHSVAILVAILSIWTCGSARADQAFPLIPNTSSDNYNYVPSVIQTTDGIRRIWWCGGPNDTIFYQAFNENNGGQPLNAPTPVLAEGPPGSWDSVFTCDPSVVKGAWNNPLGDGVTYSFAMYYTGTDDPNGHNGVGVAFSNDGVSWNKYPYSILRDQNPPGPSYGLGEQSVISAAGGSELYLFVVNAESQPQTVQAYYSPDGLHLNYYNNVTTNGLIPDAYGNRILAEPDFAFDDATAKLYVATNRTNTPGILDIYRISWDQMATGSWEYLASIGPGTAYNPTGSPLNGNAGLLRNEFGRIFLPNPNVYFSVAPQANSVQPSSIWEWDTSIH